MFLRTATDSDRELITAVIARSSRSLGLSHYSPEVIEAALQSCFGLDSQLLRDGTYYLAFDGENVAGCGGWSYRETLFGSDNEPNRRPEKTDPSTGAAKIRAFFILPEFARQGVASFILQRCEAEARRMGFRKLQLMATLPGIAFYRSQGYLEQESIMHRLNQDHEIKFVPMTKEFQQL
jgi:GNAT superfamily N-acetyltransferase